MKLRSFGAETGGVEFSQPFFCFSADCNYEVVVILAVSPAKFFPEDGILEGETSPYFPRSAARLPGSLPLLREFRRTGMTGRLGYEIPIGISAESEYLTGAVPESEITK
jgi:hypothetical protein